ncbi:MAG: hypothetical protein R2795_18940 [Saprospiraceae bacterium]
MYKPNAIAVIALHQWQLVSEVESQGIGQCTHPVANTGCTTNPGFV